MGNHAARTPLIVNSARSFRLVPGSTRSAPINTIIGPTASALRHVAPGAAPWRCVAASRPPASRRDRGCPRPGPSSVACRCPGVGLLRPCAPGLAVIDLGIASRIDGRSVHAPRDERFAPHRIVQASPIIGLPSIWLRSGQDRVSVDSLRHGDELGLRFTHLDSPLGELSNN